MLTKKVPTHLLSALLKILPGSKTVKYGFLESAIQVKRMLRRLTCMIDPIFEK